MSNITGVEPLAVVAHDLSNVVVVFCELAKDAHRSMATLGLTAVHDKRWTGPVHLLEPVCAELDRLGYRWGLDRFDAPRTWAERMFAECPTRLSRALYEAVGVVLAGEHGDADHAAVLQYAWAQAHRNGH